MESSPYAYLCACVCVHVCLREFHPKGFSADPARWSVTLSRAGAVLPKECHTMALSAVAVRVITFIGLGMYILIIVYHALEC